MIINGKFLEAGIPLFFSIIVAILFFLWPFVQFNKEMLQAISKRNVCWFFRHNIGFINSLK